MATKAMKLVDAVKKAKTEYERMRLQQLMKKRHRCQHCGGSVGRSEMMWKDGRIYCTSCTGS